MQKAVQFAKEVRQEATKVTWPTRREVIVTSVMVFILVLVAAGFFLIIDHILARLIRWVLDLGA